MLSVGWHVLWNVTDKRENIIDILTFEDIVGKVYNKYLEIRFIMIILVFLIYRLKTVLLYIV
jgi:hypothetical protein